jgi:hypothetical protein
MKKFISLLLALSLLFCGCAAPAPAETTAPPTTQVPTEAPTEEPTTVPPTEEPTEAPTEAPTEPPVPTNPLTGETLEAPLEKRTFAVVINNVPGAMPMHGVSKADLFFEMFVNDYCTRGLAMFTDLTKIPSIGSVRSLRYNFTDLCQIFDAVVVHLGGSDQVMGDLAGSGVDNVNASYGGTGYYYRDQARLNAGYATEHTLMVRGQETVDYAAGRGIRVTADAGADYGLRFAEDGTPAEGETANVVTLHMIHGHMDKQTVMKYDPDQGKYLFHQYGYPVYDSAQQQNVYFENVIVLLAPVTNQGVYHVADLNGSGEGWFACGGKIIPIKWSHEKQNDPIVLTLADGTPLELGVGSSYIALAPLSSVVEYE